MRLPYIYMPLYKGKPIHYTLFNNAPQAWTYCTYHDCDMFSSSNEKLLNERRLKKKGYSLRKFKLVEVK